MAAGAALPLLLRPFRLENQSARPSPASADVMQADRSRVPPLPYKAPPVRSPGGRHQILARYQSGEYPQTAVTVAKVSASEAVGMGDRGVGVELANGAQRLGPAGDSWGQRVHSVLPSTSKHSGLVAESHLARPVMDGKRHSKRRRSEETDRCGFPRVRAISPPT